MSLDPVEIARLHAAYCYVVDHRDGPGLAALFSPEGTLAVPGKGEIIGADALTEFGRNAPAGIHLVGWPHLDSDGRARTAFTFTSVEVGHLISGYYTDEFARGDAGQLVFRRRDIDSPVRWWS